MDSGDGSEATVGAVTSRFGDAVEAAETGEMLHLHDFDGAAYAGDIGELAATHPESAKLGFADSAEFDRKVATLRDGGGVSRGGEFAAILERDATVGVEEVARIVNEAQDPDRLRDGFSALVAALDGSVRVVTAGPVGGSDGCRIGAEHVLAVADHPELPVVGSEIEPDPGGGVRVRRYCAREQKVARVEAAAGPLADRPVAAVGDSATDTEMLQVADQSWALGDGALPAATIDATADRTYRGVAVSALLVDALYTPGSYADRLECATDRAARVVADNPSWALPALTAGPRADPVTDAVVALYADLRTKN